MKKKIYFWWYLSIAGGFLLLAGNRWMAGESLWLVLLRVAIAIGFILLAWITRSTGAK